MARTVYFESHIRPMFREIDQVHMLSLFGLDLWNVDDVKTNLRTIDRFVNATPRPADANAVMPPSDTGGPWPEGWIAVWNIWKNDPKTLPLGSATYTTRDAGGGNVTLVANGSPSVANAAVWLERLPGRDIPPRYVLYEEPPRANVKGSDTPFTLEEDFPRGSGTSVEVTDRNGTHKVALP